jgi:prepilin-type N-terminal cleavage/methylation domain-containing protein
LRLNGRPNPAGRTAPRGGAGGFSLIELLIVLALLLIMVVMMRSSGSRSRQERDKAACEKNLHQDYLALEIFANDHDGLFPVVADAKTSEAPLSLLVPKYTVATESFICPGGNDPGLPEGESFARRKISYAYYMGLRAADAGEPLMSDRQINKAPRNKGDVLFSTTGQPPGNNHHKYGGNVLFVGGDVKMSRPKAEFALQPAQNAVLLNPKP